MFISLKRIIRNGFNSFFRNFGLNVGTVFVVGSVVFLATMVFIFNLASDILISNIQEKIDISVYLKEDVDTDRVMELKSVIAKIPEVKKVEYISKEQILEKFIERHKDDPVLMESLTEVGKNPFLGSLSIKAWQASQYGQVVDFLANSSFKDIIEKVDYYQRKPIINKIFSLTSAINRASIFFAIILGIIAFLVAFNTIKIAIDSSSEEISIMRLVGASNWFIQGPFLVQGIIAGILAVFITFLISFVVVFTLDSKVELLAPGISIFNLFTSNLLIIILIQLSVGIGLGIFSSLVAIRKYLKV